MIETITEQPKTSAVAANFTHNGGAAAAILSAGIGSFALAAITVVSDQSSVLKSLLTFYKPTGPLSGVTTVSIAIWLLVWVILDRLWKDRDLPLKKINIVAIALLVLSLLATFPPLGDLF